MTNFTMGKINCAILLFLAAYPLCAQTEAPSQAIESARESLAGRIELMKSKEAFEAEKDALESAVKALEERNSAVKAKTAELQKNAENIRAQAKSLTGEISKKQEALNRFEAELENRRAELKKRISNRPEFAEAAAGIISKLDAVYANSAGNPAKKLRALYAALDSLLAADSCIVDDGKSVAYGLCVKIDKSSKTYLGPKKTEESSGK